MNEVVLDLDRQAVLDLIFELATRRDHLDRGTPLPSYDDQRPSDFRLAFIMWEIREQLGLAHMYNEKVNPYLGAIKVPIVMSLRLDERTARILEITLYTVGEYYAAGAPVERASDEVETRLDAVLDTLQSHVKTTTTTPKS